MQFQLGFFFRCLVDTFDIDVTKTLLQSLHDNNQLTEVIFDHVLMLSSPANQNYAKLTCDTYCMILSILNDISTVRALVEMYVDELRNNGDISANSLGEISKRLFFSFKGDKIAFFQNFVNTVLA